MPGHEVHDCVRLETSSIYLGVCVWCELGACVWCGPRGKSLQRIFHARVVGLLALEPVCLAVKDWNLASCALWKVFVFVMSTRRGVVNPSGLVWPMPIRARPDSRFLFLFLFVPSTAQRHTPVLFSLFLLSPAWDGMFASVLSVYQRGVYRDANSAEEIRDCIITSLTMKGPDHPCRVAGILAWVKHEDPVYGKVNDFLNDLFEARLYTSHGQISHVHSKFMKHLEARPHVREFVSKYICPNMAEAVALVGGRLYNIWSFVSECAPTHPSVLVRQFHLVFADVACLCEFQFDINVFCILHYFFAERLLCTFFFAFHCLCTVDYFNCLLPVFLDPSCHSVGG